MSVLELALQRNKYKHLSDEEWRWFLQQVEGRERTADKLPTFAAIDDWWYPVRLSCEQCSSELTARYKAQLLSTFNFQLSTLLDLTAGYGVDTYFLSEQFAHTDYVEQNAELCRIAEHNFSLIDNRKSIIVHNTTAEEFIASAGEYDLIFADPARRDAHGGKVFKLTDCTPNIVELSGGKGTITAIDLAEPEKAFVFTREEEQEALYTIHHTPYTYLYEPSASILKAGAYKLVAQRFGLQKLDVNTHLYASDQLVENFPGRVWEIKSKIENQKSKIEQANILVRNYPLTPEQLKKKLHLRDGGTGYVIGCRVAGKPTLFQAERV